MAWMQLAILMAMGMPPTATPTAPQAQTPAKTVKSQAVVAEIPARAMARASSQHLAMTPQVAPPTCQNRWRRRHCRRLRCRRRWQHLCADLILGLVGYLAALTACIGGRISIVRPGQAAEALSAYCSRHGCTVLKMCQRTHSRAR